MRSKKRLSFAVYTADRWEHVCPEIRVAGPMELAGFKLTRGSTWEGSRLIVSPERVSEADIVVIQRDFPSFGKQYDEVVNQARAQKKPIVYELDDLLSELPEEHPDVVHYITSRSAILKAIVEADAVIGSTPMLQDYLRAYNPNAYLQRNYLDDRFWKLKSIQRRDRDQVLIGYMGGHSHAYDLETITPALKHVLERYGRKIRFKFWGAPPPADLRDRFNVEWDDVGLVSYQEFAAYFMEQECDIFIAPLQDNLFNRCKSPLKFLEYSALAVPGVYSRIAPYESVVVQGENGYLASTLEEWERYLGELVEDADLRSKLGNLAQETVRSDWLLSEHVQEWKDTFQELYSNSTPVAETGILRNVVQKAHLWQEDLEFRVQNQGVEIKDLRQQVSALERQVGSLEEQLAERDQAVQAAYELYLDILNSNGWKLMQALFGLRRRLIPLGSRRERIAKITLRSLRSMKAGGIRAVPHGIARLVTALFKRDTDSLLASASPPHEKTVKTALVPGLVISTPGISILIPRGGEVIRPDEEAIQEWVSRQTYSDVDIVTWDQEAQRASITGEGGRTWKAPDVPAVVNGLRTDYLCVASYDLLQQNSTYLETNLIALKSESLAFTVNLRGHAEWALNRLREGRLPGDSDEPLLRQFAAREAVREDFSLDLSSWIERHKGSPGVIGKVIRHTTNEYDAENTLPFDLPMPAAETAILGRDLFERSNSGIPWEVAAHALHPLETVLPPGEEPSELPTIIVVMTFLAVGGAEQIALKVMQNLRDQFRFVVVAFEELDPELGTTADAFRQITPYVYSLPDYLNESLNASFMDRLIERFQPRTIYIANGTTWIFNALGEIKNRHPELRIANQVYDSEVGWINRYDISLILNIDAHIGVNPKICQAYLDKGAKPEQVYQIENGIDSGEINPADYSEQKIAMLKKQFNLPEGKKIVTFASRIHPQKRPVDFVELARRFSSDPSVVFFMVGDGPLAKQVQEEIEKIGLKNIFRHPFYRPISDVLAVSDVFVLPSEFEGMPMIIIEAQAMGKPVVVTDVGNNREVIAATGAGVVVSQIGDVTALREGVLQMLENPPDPEQLRQATLSHYDISIVAEKYRNAWLGGTDA